MDQRGAGAGGGGAAGGTGGVGGAGGTGPSGRGGLNKARCEARSRPNCVASMARPVAVATPKPLTLSGAPVRNKSPNCSARCGGIRTSVPSLSNAPLVSPPGP
ncbi:hypothetical protein E1J23_10745 [Xanthomonas gardneri]|nr:hypothetical protein [Xanthomonas hortorum pv. vitians]NMI47955.1 hypothetical protein [Xanthomonas hortorum pv. gardneri]NMI51787.1 hypothetical protein [Xanthomonas hortorum pv. taraxaci]NMI26366.1 hypothetical protein [Xanthomonas hortorum pv. vitians]NMI30074.1 hypothetical protein [Xanthomonas hortorum pv. vitians]